MRIRRDANRHTPGIREELRERGFAVVDHHIDPDVISRLQQDTSHFPREFLDTEEDTGAFVLAVADSVHQGIHEGQINGEAYIGMWITGNFSVLKIEGSFFKHHTNAFAVNKPKRSLLSFSPPSPEIFEPMGMYAFGGLSRSEDHLIVAAQQLLDRLDYVSDAARCCMDVITQLGLEEVFSSRRYDGNISCELVHYREGTAVSNLDIMDPTHVDAGRQRTIAISVPLHSHADLWVAGRTKEKREWVQQDDTQLFILEADGEEGREPTIHHPVVVGHDRDSLVIRVFGNSCDVVERKLSEWAKDANWRSTPVSERVAFSTGVDQDIASQGASFAGR
ncbi:MAG TPA: hypothetical protein PKB15_05930 [Acidimicrobiia bacterium]|nr:hypothetical protein [Acidimicrobiia bacterium]